MVININELAMAYPDVTFHVHARDLAHFGRQLISDTRAALRQEMACLDKDKLEPLFSTDEVKAALKVSDSTLHRWAGKKYLVPIIVGGEKRYRQQDINRILNKE